MPIHRAVKTSVLVVDNDDYVLNALEMFVRAAGYDVITAESGTEALEIAAVKRPAAILCDAVMPGMSGADVLENLRHAPTTSGIPFIMMSAYDESRAGVPEMDGFLSKPFQMREMVSVIETAIKARTSTFAC